MNSPFDWRADKRPSVILQDKELRAHHNRSVASAKVMEQANREGRPVHLAYGRSYGKKPAKGAAR